jgi:anthranilate phosphoribosyltransferase
MNIAAILGRVSAGDDLSMDEMASAIDAIMTGLWTDGQIGLLLTALRAKGETFAEIAGAAKAMRQHMTPIRTRRRGLVDTCGTGGDGSRTFNISTAAALVTAAAGVPVAKHGNRAMSSRTGSADVLAALGVNIEADIVCVEGCLDELGICFCFAPLLHRAMKQVTQVRKQLGVPTIFNLLGPLANPAGAHFQLLGVGRDPLRPLLAEALSLLGSEHALVVHGEDGLDEVTLAGRTLVTEVAGKKLREFEWTPEDFGLRRQGLSELLVETPADSAAIIRGVLAGCPGAARDIVVLNAAAALWTAGHAAEPRACAATAAEAIDSGEASRLLVKLADRSHT